MSTRSSSWWGLGSRAALVLVAVLSGAVLWSLALRASPAQAAAAADVAIIADNPPPPSVPTGAPSTYTINFTCSAVVGNSCGQSPTITIPLNLTSTNAATPDMSTWSYSASSSLAGLIASTQVVGENLVVTLSADGAGVDLAEKPLPVMPDELKKYFETPATETK